MSEGVADGLIAIDHETDATLTELRSTGAAWREVGTNSPLGAEGGRYRDRERVGDGCGRFALMPERPARTITLLVRLTASRST